MSAIGEKLRQSIRRIVQDELKKSSVKASIACKVISVSGDPIDGLMTCDCAPIDGSAIIEDVQLCANFNDNTNEAGFLLIPKEGSIVTVSFKNNSDAFVSMVSVVDYVYLNGNKFGGIVRVNDLVTKINIIENSINAISIWAATVTPPLVLPEITPTTKTEIENTKVLHGDGSLI